MRRRSNVCRYKLDGIAANLLFMFAAAEAMFVAANWMVSLPICLSCLQLQKQIMFVAAEFTTTAEKRQFAATTPFWPRQPLDWDSGCHGYGCVVPAFPPGPQHCRPWVVLGTSLCTTWVHPSFISVYSTGYNPV